MASRRNFWIVISWPWRRRVRGRNGKNRLQRLSRHKWSPADSLWGTAPLAAADMQVDPAGNLILVTDEEFATSSNALLASPCGGTPFAYLKLSSSGQILCSTYLPYGASLQGTTTTGLPIFQFNDLSYAIDDSQPNRIFTGCIVDSPTFSNGGSVTLGEIITVFGSGLGPMQGVAAQVENGILPASLGGTRLLVNGQPAPLLYSSYGQVNAVLPYSLAAGSIVPIQSEFDGEQSNRINSRLNHAIGTETPSGPRLCDDSRRRSYGRGPIRMGSTWTGLGRGSNQYPAAEPTAVGDGLPFRNPATLGRPRFRQPGPNRGNRAEQVRAISAPPRLLRGRSPAARIRP